MGESVMTESEDRLEHIERKLDTLTARIDEMIAQSLFDRVNLQMTRNMLETAEAARLAMDPPRCIGK